MQTAGGVDDHHVLAARLSGGEAVVDDRRRIAARRLLDDLAVTAPRPFRELFDRGRAERVGGDDERRLAELLEAVGDLADRRRLAGAVDADDEQHARFGGHIDKLRPGCLRAQHLDDHSRELVEQAFA